MSMLQSPWGKITGIRPVKIVRDLLEKGYSQQQALEEFMQEYGVSRKKAEFSVGIAALERDILQDISEKDICLYIGIPFCKTRCLYCSFVTNTASTTAHLMQPFVDALQKEIAYTAELLKKTDFRIISLYIGGGTPTALPAEMLDTIIKSCYESFDLTNLREFTVEAGRPDTIDVEKLGMLKQNKVNRISINPQTMNNETLKRIGRLHTTEQIVESFELARQQGFDHINMDLIAGLPGEGLEDFIHTVNQVEALSPESTTVHTLSVKRGSKLHETLGDYALTDGDTAVRMVDYAMEYISEKGKQPYYLYRQKNMVGNLENTGYAKPGCECLYNIMIMEETNTILSLGCGGVTKVVNLPGNRIERIFNVKEVYDYVNRIDEMCKRKDALINLLNF